MREGDAFLRGVVAKVQIARERIGGHEWMVVEHHGQARESRQALPADTRGQIDATQIDRDSAQRADAIQAQLNVARGADAAQGAEVVQDARGSFTVNGPKPFNLRMAREALADLFVIERLAPGKLHRLELKVQAAGVVDQTIAKFAVAQHDAGSLQQ